MRVAVSVVAGCSALSVIPLSLVGDSDAQRARLVCACLVQVDKADCRPVAGAHTKSQAVGDNSMWRTRTDAGAIETAAGRAWQASITQAKGHLTDISKMLIVVAKDESRFIEERREAILLLGQLGTSESIGFLIKNVTLVLPIESGHTEEDRLKETPCLYALRSGRKWSVAQAILASLDVKKSKYERMYLSIVMERILLKNHATAIVEEEIRSAPDSVRKENLIAIRDFLPD